MMTRIELAVILFLLGLCIALAGFIAYGWSVVHGQDLDPNYYCLYANQYPFKQLCHDQEERKINDTYNQLLERAKEFNEEYGK